MAVIGDSNRAPARELLGDLVAPAIMTDEARAARIGDAAQAIGAVGALNYKSS